VGDLPWFKFNTADWITGVAGLSMGERGAYVSLIALMYDCGGPIKRDDRALARSCGAEARNFRRALEALIRRGKITEVDGFLFNGRTQKELDERHGRSAKASDAAKKRWRNPSQRVGFSESDSASPSHDDKNTSKNNDRKIQTHAPSNATRAGARIQKIESLETSVSKETRASPSEPFDRFWSGYPHKVGKPAAVKAFAKLAPEVDAIIAGVERYIATKPPDRSWLNPATFLHQRRWEDQPAPTGAKPNGHGKRSLADAANDLAQRLGEQQREREMRSGDGGVFGGPPVRLLPGGRGERS
jgi:uncharacterized protein YdaU (DUF1376 family)